MKTKLQGLGQCALQKTILAALLLGSVNAAHAVITIDVSFDGTNTLLDVSGNWDFFRAGANGNITLGQSNPFSFTNSTDGFDSASIGLALNSGSPLPSFTFTPVGDVFLFNETSVSAANGYTAGDAISASISVGGDVFGLLATPVQGGTYTGGGNTLTWAAVPEPSSYGALVGCLALGVALVRRRRG